MEDRQLVAKALAARLVEAFRVLETAIPPSDADQDVPAGDATAEPSDRPRQGRLRLFISSPYRENSEK